MQNMPFTTCVSPETLILIAWTPDPAQLTARMRALSE